MEQKKFLHDHIIDVRDEPARRETLFDWLFLSQAKKVRTRNFTPILIPVLNLSYKMLNTKFCLGLEL